MDRIYFVDTENVGKNGLKGLLDLDADDMVVLFHNREFGELSEFIANLLSQGKCTVEVIDVGTKKEKNAMDFSIAAKLGMEVLRNGDAKEYFIVSRDKGFDCAASFLESTFSNVKGKVNRIDYIYESFPENVFDFNFEMGKVESLYGKNIASISIKCMRKSSTLDDYKQQLRKALWKESYEKRGNVFEATKELFALRFC